MTIHSFQFILYFDSPVGWIELASDGDNLNQALFRESKIFDEKPNAVLETAGVQFAEYFSHNRKKFELPLKPNGTTFQMKVWDELLKIPYGKTSSYHELAVKLGDEKVIRAAANANAKNPVAIIVPCHRIIGTDGSLTGYAGGLWRKQWLLDFENGVGRLEF